MYVLVDYDNYDKNRPSDTSKGLPYLVDVLISKIANNVIIDFNKINIRLYGGWYDKNVKTRKAQDLTIQSASNFRSIYSLKDKAGSIAKVQVIVDLACSLLNNPYQHYYYTVRKRPIEFKLQCKHPINIGCNNSKCPIINMQEIINSGRCSDSSCNISIKGLMEKEDQKMVDSMITLDIDYLGRTYDSGIVIVSSDDDFIPAMYSVTRSKLIYHVIASDNYTNIDYPRLLGSNYIPIKV